jgi:hypothetical protein
MKGVIDTLHHLIDASLSDPQLLLRALGRKLRE